MDWVIGARYRIVYESESGGITERTIDLLGTSRAYDGRAYLRAYCHLREEERTFRVDRVFRAERLGLTVPTPRPFTTAAPSSPAWQSPSSPLASVHAQRTSASCPQPNKMPPAWVPPARTLPAWTPPEPSPAIPKKAERPSLGQLLGQALVYGIGILMIGSCLNGISASGGSSSDPWSRTYPSAAVAPRPLPRTTPTPAPPPKPPIEETTIGGTVLRTIRSGGTERYEVPALGLSTMEKSKAVLAIRLPAFLDATGLASPDLVRRYLEADTNGSGKLSFDELEAFQKKTYREFRYQANDTALKPDEFLAQGGGDCEDFALYTAGLLRFWGWTPYLGCLGPSRGGSGHAICLSYEEGSFPSGFAYFTLTDWRAEDGSPLPSGCYVPIDYDEVGGLTNAAEPGWKLRAVYVPEEAYGLSM